MVEGMVVAVPNGVKADGALAAAAAAAKADSPKSVLEDEVILWPADLCVLCAKVFQRLLPFGLFIVLTGVCFFGVQNQKISESKDGNASFATEPVKQEQEDENTDDFVDASSSLPVDHEIASAGVPPVKAMKDEEQLLEPVKQDKVDDFLDASLSIPIDLEAKNGDVSLITEAMKKEEEQLEEARIKAEEEEEARKREEAAKLAFDPKARYSKLDELLTKTQLYSEFLLEKMDKIADVCISHCVLTVFYASLL